MTPARLDAGFDQRPDWMDQARCRGADPELFYPSRGAADSQYRLARVMCAECPVSRECLEYGMNEGYGIWGGLSRNQRHQLAAARKKPPVVVPVFLDRLPI